MNLFAREKKAKKKTTLEEGKIQRKHHFRLALLLYHPQALIIILNIRLKRHIFTESDHSTHTSQVTL